MTTTSLASALRNCWATRQMRWAKSSFLNTNLSCLGLSMFQKAETKGLEHVQKDRGVAGESREATAVRSEYPNRLKKTPKALKIEGA